MARFIGTETEFGIATPTALETSPIVTSTHAVVAYASRRMKARTPWDFQEEHPLRDTRGFDLKRYHTVPIVPADALGVANVVLVNGGRFYVDHAHPEYSSPETSNPKLAALYDVAGLVIMNQAVADVASYTHEGMSVLERHDPCPPLKIYKNNVDGKGASYGFHENYQYSRSIDFDALSRGLIPYFVARQVIVGAGRVGIGEEGQHPGFQISQRADYFYQEVSLETTLNRGIINTRDEPHADTEHFGRLHVINGDATMSHTSSFLKLGLTSMVIDAIERGEDFSDLTLADPVAAFQDFSHDPTLRHTAPLADGRALSALEIMDAYRARLRAETPVEAEVLERYDEVADLLRVDPLSTSHILDWTAKLALVQSFRSRGLSWDDAKLKLIDLQYTDIDPKKSLYHALVRKGRMRTLFSDDDIAAAATTPPEDSRAYFRGRVLERFAPHIKAASWQNISLIEPTEGAVEIALTDVDGLGKTETDQILHDARTPGELIAALRNRGILPPR